MKENGCKRKVAFASLLSRPDCLIKYTSIKYIDKHTRQNAAPRALCSLPYVATSSAPSIQKKVVNLPSPPSVQSQNGRLYRLCYLTRRENKKTYFFFWGGGEGGATHSSKWNIDPHFNPPPAFHNNNNRSSIRRLFFSLPFRLDQCVWML
jgi:hypothetical protein